MPDSLKPFRSLEVSADAVCRQFGDNLFSRRKLLRLSTRELAAASSISKSNLSKLQRGLGNPSLTTICALARALRTSPDKLLIHL